MVESIICKLLMNRCLRPTKSATALLFSLQGPPRAPLDLKAKSFGRPSRVDRVALGWIEIGGQKLGSVAPG